MLFDTKKYPLIEIINPLEKLEILGNIIQLRPKKKKKKRIYERQKITLQKLPDDTLESGCNILF